MRILTYKRTHVGDPGADGIFGCSDCMGAVRGRRFDAAIGIGGIGAEPRMDGIDGRITWVGLNPSVVGHTPRGPILTFDRFLLLDNRGPLFADFAPDLSRRMYGRNVRAISVGYTARQQREAERIISWAFGGKAARAVGSLGTRRFAASLRTACLSRGSPRCDRRIPRGRRPSCD